MFFAILAAAVITLLNRGHKQYGAYLTKDGDRPLNKNETLTLNSYVYVMAITISNSHNVFNYLLIIFYT